MILFPRLALFVGLIAGLFPLASGASAQVDDPLLTQLETAAVDAWVSRDYAKAADALEALIVVTPEDGDAWYRLGYALHAQGKLEEALIAHLEAAEKSERYGSTAMFNVACVHALSSRSEKALSWLQKAADAGFNNWRHAAEDKDLAAVRANPKFGKIVEQMRAAAEGSGRVVAIFVHDGVELLDFAGPGEVFASSRGKSGEHFRVITVAATMEAVTSQRFLKVVPEFTFATCPQPDVLVLPGGATGRAILESEGLVPWVQRVSKKAKVVMSVCTGALILGKAGLLDGIQSTTHFGSLDALERSTPNTEVRADLRIVDSGKIVTTAGISAGIDGALHVVARIFGEESATQCAQYMEYRWVRDHFRSGKQAVEAGTTTGR